MVVFLAGASSGDVLMDAVSVVKQFMERDKGEIRFSLVALGNKN